MNRRPWGRPVARLPRLARMAGRHVPLRTLVTQTHELLLRALNSLHLDDVGVMKSFPRLRVSRAGHFKEFRTGDATPLPILSHSFRAGELGGPPFRNSIK